MSLSKKRNAGRFLAGIFGFKYDCDLDSMCDQKQGFCNFSLTAPKANLILP